MQTLEFSFWLLSAKGLDALIDANGLHSGSNKNRMTPSQAKSRKLSP